LRKKHIDHFEDAFSVGFSVEIKQETVAEYGTGYAFYIVNGRRVSSFKNAEGFCAEYEILRSAGTCSPANVVFYELRTVWISWTGFTDDINCVVDHFISYRDFANKVLIAYDVSS